MLKRNMILYSVGIFMIFAFALAVRFSIQDREIYHVAKIDDLKDIRFLFFGTYDERDLSITEKYLPKELDNSEYILEVVPTGRLKLYQYTILQEVQVTQCIKGGKQFDHNIWITADRGFWYKEETDAIYNWGLSNLMSEGDSYVVVLYTMTYMGHTYYYNDFYLGALACDAAKPWLCMDVSKKYDYIELAPYEFFVDSEASAKHFYALKAYVFDYLYEKYGYEPGA